MKLVWKDIPGYEDHYQVSACGQVRSLTREVCDGRVYEGKALKQQPDNPGGYLSVSLCKNGKSNFLRVHALVLLAFHGACPKNMECRHLDGNKKNNKLWNLRWGTRQENIADRMVHGTTIRGESCGTSKLCELDVWLIRNVVSTQANIASFFGISPSNVSMIRLGRTWKHLPMGTP